MSKLEGFIATYNFGGHYPPMVAEADLERVRQEAATYCNELLGKTKSLEADLAAIKARLDEANNRIKLVDNLISDILEHDCMESHSIINYAINTVIPASEVKG
jgi:hypothetical protein